MHFLLTCTAGLEALAKKEIVKCGGTITQVFDRLVFFSWDYSLVAKVNLHSRVGNKLYLVAWENECRTFDALYDTVFQIPWKKYITRYFPIHVKATSIQSELSSTPAVQKIVKKAIVDSLTGKTGHTLREEDDRKPFEVLAFLRENRAYILINTSGDTLYKRGYKAQTWEAPIKESLAAWIIMLSNWNFRTPFLDFCCGSGTIAIEAALIARNVAPGMGRTFAFENRDFIDEKILEQEIVTAKKHIFPGKYDIRASDIDPDMIEIAKINAKNAAVEDTITFSVRDIASYTKERWSWTLLSNPPYGERLNPKDLQKIYADIAEILRKNGELFGGIITAFEEFGSMISSKDWKTRKLYNGNLKSYLYLKKK